MSNIIAIVGRPNVGKSTFFNRLVGMRQAIVDPTSGVTRDRHYGVSDWNGVHFSVIDTGGYVHDSGDIFEEEIKNQVRLAIEEADAILFMVDVVEGLTSLDEDVADMLRRTKKKVYLAGNKADTNERKDMAAEFYRLGLGEVFPLSAVNGSGSGELLDAIVADLEERPLSDVPDLPKFAIIGRPNVGKSSLINALLGANRSIVTPVAGTTRDSVFTPYNSFGMEFLLVDTAGIRKRSKGSEDIEFYSVMPAIRSIENSDVCLLMIDATQGFEAQDQSILHLVERNKKGLVILVNKWDLVEKDHTTTKAYTELIQNRIAPFQDVPIIFISVKEKQRVLKALELALKVYENRSRRITTSKLNELMLPLIEAYPPPMSKGKNVTVKYITQLPMSYPGFAFFCNLPQYVKDPYKRFLENQIRKNFDFTGVPIDIFIRKK